MGRNILTFLDQATGMLVVAFKTDKSAYANIQPTAKGNVVIATTSGNQKLSGAAGELSIGVNVYGPAPQG